MKRDIPEGWELKKIGNILKVKHGKNQKAVEIENGKNPILGTGGVIGRTNNYLYNKPSVLIGRKGTIDRPQYMEKPFWTVDTLFYTEIKEICHPKWLYYKFCSIPWKKYNEATGVSSLSASTIESIKIEFPPLNEQKKIAKILTTWDKAIELKEKLIKRKKEQKKGLMQKLLTGEVRLPGFKDKWEETGLKEVAKIIMGQSPPSSSYNDEQKGLPLIQGNADVVNRKTSPKVWTSQPTKTCQIGDIIMTVRAPVGTVSRSSHEACIGRGVCLIRGTIDQDFLYYQLISNEHRWVSLSQGSTFESINSTDIKEFKVKVPPEEEQRAISEVLIKIDQALDLYERELIQLKQQKKGLMQLLLTGKARVKV